MCWCLLACGLIGYVLGCLNGAIVISRIFKHEDVRQKGSGNAGLTNFLRNYGGASTFLVILIDVGKVFLAGCLAGLVCPDQGDLARMIAGVCAMVGHMFPIIFGFHGGKGILSGAAVALMMDWRIFAIALGLFLVIVILTHYVSLGSVIAAVEFGVGFIVFFPGQIWINVLGVVSALLAIYMHRGNIDRLLRGEERKTYLHKNKNKE
jgi:glycerol-3-phosphate acyltransferase PlsY